MDDRMQNVAARKARRSTASLTREAWRIFQIMAEFVEGFEQLAQIRPSVSFFGSSGRREGHPWYRKAEEIAKRLSDAGFAVVSAGGPGIMEAANRGAYAGARRASGSTSSCRTSSTPTPTRTSPCTSGTSLPAR